MKTKALATFLKVKIGNIIQENDNEFTCNGEWYLVLTDEEAGYMAREYAERLIEECYITEEIRNSFLYNHINMDSAIESILNDGRGSLLAIYDGQENEISIEIDKWTFEKEYFYIYRTN